MCQDGALAEHAPTEASHVCCVFNELADRSSSTYAGKSHHLPELPRRGEEKAGGYFANESARRLVDVLGAIIVSQTSDMNTKTDKILFVMCGV